MKEKAKNPSSLQWQLIEIRLMEKRSLVKIMRLVNMTNSLTVGDNGGFKVIIFVLSNSSQGQSNS